MGLSKGNKFRGYPTDEERVECSVGLEATAIEQDAVWRGWRGSEGRGGEERGKKGREGGRGEGLSPFESRDFSAHSATSRPSLAS